MGITDKELRKLKFGLTLKNFMERSREVKARGRKTDPKGIETEASENVEEYLNKSSGISFRDLETDSGIPHPSIVQIVNGKKNPSWTTICALLEGLEITLTQFAIVYDKISGEEIMAHKKEIDRKKEKRENRKSKDKPTSKPIARKTASKKTSKK